MEPNYSKIDKENDSLSMYFALMQHIVEPYFPRIYQMKNDFFRQLAQCRKDPKEPKDVSLVCEQKAIEKIQKLNISFQKVSKVEANNLMICIQEKCKENKGVKVENSVCLETCFTDFTTAMKKHYKQLLD